jgi:hypothetical protein
MILRKVTYGLAGFGLFVLAMGLAQTVALRLLEPTNTCIALQVIYDRPGASGEVAIGWKLRTAKDCGTLISIPVPTSIAPTNPSPLRPGSPSTSSINPAVNSEPYTQGQTADSSELGAVPPDNLPGSDGTESTASGSSTQDQGSLTSPQPGGVAVVPPLNTSPSQAERELQAMSPEQRGSLYGQYLRFKVEQERHEAGPTTLGSQMAPEPPQPPVVTTGPQTEPPQSPVVTTGPQTEPPQSPVVTTGPQTEPPQSPVVTIAPQPWKHPFADKWPQLPTMVDGQ